MMRNRYPITVSHPSLPPITSEQRTDRRVSTVVDTPRVILVGRCARTACNILGRVCTVGEEAVGHVEAEAAFGRVVLAGRAGRAGGGAGEGGEAGGALGAGGGGAGIKIVDTVEGKKKRKGKEGKGRENEWETGEKERKMKEKRAKKVIKTKIRHKKVKIINNNSPKKHNKTQKMSLANIKTTHNFAPNGKDLCVVVDIVRQRRLPVRERDQVATRRAQLQLGRHLGRVRVAQDARVGLNLVVEVVVRGVQEAGALASHAMEQRVSKGKWEKRGEKG